MKIPLYPRPSNPREEITFDLPSVFNAMEYCSSDAEQEEHLTTSYLNDLQPKDRPHSDAKFWTAQDRRTALWWIFTNSRIDTTLNASYECKYCGEIHHTIKDMRELDFMAMLLPEEVSEQFQITVSGVPHEFTITHLNGQAMEHLESTRNMLPPETDPTFRKEWADLRVKELAHQLRLPDEPADWLDAVIYRYNKINQMALDSEFQPLVAAVQLFNRKNAHGLNIHVEKGVTYLILPPHQCKNAEEGEAKLTPLHMQFRVSNFLPDFRSEWLDFADE